MSIRLRVVLALFFLVLVGPNLFGQVSLVKDINTKGDSLLSANPEFITSLNGKVIYVAEDFRTGRELWISDGTKAGTHILKDINPSASSDPQNTTRVFGSTPVSDSKHFVVLNNKALFVADDGEHGFELWATDGTSAGTVMLKDIFAGVSGSIPAELTLVENLVFFSADNGISGRELWRTDGTAAGTFIIKDINPGSIGSNPVELTSLGDQLVFTANDGVAGAEPWLSDATAGGTQMLKDIFNGDFGSSPADYKGVSDEFYFRVGSVIWKSDGTAGGTVSFFGDPEAEAAFIPQAYVNGKLYFIKNDFSIGVESIYASDGTLAGTQPIYSFPYMPGVTYYYNWLRVVNGELFFAFSHEDRTQIDADPALPLLVGVTIQKLNSDNGFFDDFLVNEGSVYDPGPMYAYPEALDILYHNNVFYVLNSIAGGVSILKKEDGSGTADFEAIASFSVVSGDALAFANNILFFRGGYSSDLELWKSSGSFATTKLVYNQYMPASSNPQRFIEYNGRLYFQAADGVLADALNLWTTDGTEAGSNKIRPDIILDDQDMAVYNNELYFIALNGDTKEFWKTDGTNEGTVLVKSSGIESIVGGSSTLFLLGYDETSGYELWKTDGTEAGTIVVKDIWPGEDSSFPSGFVLFNNKLVFRADDGTTGFEYWVSDGSVAGTTLLRDINPGSEGSNPGLIGAIVHDGKLYFDASDGTHGTELWVTDGTFAGTQLFIDQITGPGSSSPRVIGGLGSSVIFSGLATGEPQAKLWASSGTTSQLLFDGVIDRLQPRNNTEAYFSYDGDLWKTDGTPANTTKVVDFPSSSNDVDVMGLYNDDVFLTMHDGVHGLELWKCGGTLETTKLASDVFAGAQSSDPSPLVVFNNAIYFAATDGLSGRELRKLAVTAMLKITRSGNNISPNGELSFDETEIGESSVIVLMLKNESDVPLTFSSDAVTIEGTGAAHFSTNVLTTTQLAGGESVELSVTFEPEADGDHDATVTIKSNDPINPDFVISLSGKGKMVVSIDDPLNPQINLYPNPARSSFRIEAIKPINNISLLSSSGGFTPIKTDRTSPTTMTINTDAQSGLYILRMEIDGVFVHKKVVILR